LLVVLGCFGLTSGLSAQEPTAPDPYPLAELEAAVEASRTASAEALGAALLELTLGYAHHTRHGDAVETGREALQFLGAAGDSVELARAHNQVGLAHWNLVQYDSAVAHFQEARDLWLALDDRDSLGRVYNNLGAAHYQWGNYELALTWFLEAMEYRRGTDNVPGQALALTNVGRTYHDWGLHGHARDAYEEAIRLADEADYLFGQAYARLNLGELRLEQGDLEEAHAYFRESLEAYGADPTRIDPSAALGGRILNTLGLARIDVERGDIEAALRDLLATLELSRQAEHPRYEARTRLALGEAYLATGQHESALEHLTLGLDAARERDQRPIALELVGALAEVEAARGEPARALEHLRGHLALRDSLFSEGATHRIAALEAQSEIDRQQRANLALREEQRIQEAVIHRQRTIAALTGGLLVLLVVLAGVLVYFNRRGRERARALADANEVLERTNRELRETQQEVQTLKGLVPICSSCKRVRDDEGYWSSVESYVTRRSDASFSHSICNECGPAQFPEDWRSGDEVQGS